MVSDINYWSIVAKRIFSLVLTLILLLVILKLSVFYTPFLISFVLALLIEPIIKFIMKKCRWTRRISAITVLIFFIIIILCLISWGVIALFNESNTLLENSNTYYLKVEDILDGISNNKCFEKLPNELKQNLDNTKNHFLETISEEIMKLLNNVKAWVMQVPNIIMSIFFSAISLYFMCTDKIYIIDQIEHHLPDLWTKKIAMHLHEITKTLGNYLRAEFTLIIISFIISLIGLTIYKMTGLNIGFPLLASLGIAFVDALPILGSGAVMAPWAIIEALNGNIKLGIAILALWAIMGITRNILEPKLVSKHIGIHPVFTLIAMYTGFRFIGVLGLILGPIILIILKEIYNPIIEKGVIRSLFEKE